MMRAFTLIELLVVVAVIVILAAIALPNFLNAQTRAKVARARADLATINNALESYAVDNMNYPVGAAGFGGTGDLLNLVRPVPYLGDLPRDPFTHRMLYAYAASSAVSGIPDGPFGRFVLASVGPDLVLQTTLGGTWEYDPANGTVSPGDIVRAQRPPGGPGSRESAS